MEDDRRLYQRVTADHSIQVLDGDREHPALALDISLMGMQLLCDAATAECITHQLNTNQQQIRVRIPHCDGGVDAWCNVVYIRHIADDECRIGVQFIKLLNGSYTWLEDFIDGDGIDNDIFI